MNKLKIFNKRIIRRKKRARVKIFGTHERPRLSVFKSNRFSYIQIIDDKSGKTLVSASTKELKADKKAPKQKQSEILGELIAKRAFEKGIKSVVFDRGAYKYHGRLKSIAEAARKEGMKF